MIDTSKGWMNHTLAVRYTPCECAEPTSASLKRELLSVFDAITFSLEQLRIVPVPRGVVAVPTLKF